MGSGRIMQGNYDREEVEEEEYFPGKGCTCAAFHEGECCCDVDWTDSEIYSLQEQLAAYTKDG